jgi:diaminopimelate epimerase
MRLSKHHGLGNDFLVLVDLDGRHRVDESMARALCDRRRGVGADGIIHATAASDDGADLAMLLRNADGSRAEMSGNGIRCLAHAVLRAGAFPGPTLRVATDGGIRAVEVDGDPASSEIVATVDMGAATIGEPVSSAVATRGVKVTVGNPHIVLLVDDPATAPVHQVGHTLDHETEGGANVEFVKVEDPSRVQMRVWERGVGETLACGTGACAAAAALASWEMASPEITITMPGGDVRVRVTPEAVWLTGPATWIADVEVGEPA